MGVSNYDIAAAALATGRSQDYELSILTGVDSFAYILRDRSNNQLLAYRSATFDHADRADWPAALAALVGNDPRLAAAPFGRTLLGWDGPEMTLVPTTLFDPGDPTSYLDQLTVVGLDHEVRHDELHDLGASLVFAARRADLLAAEQRFAAPPAVHVAGGLLTVWAGRSRRLNHAAVSCALRGNRMLVAGHRSGKLVYVNTFTYDGAQDAVYYLLLAYQQCDLAADRDPLYLAGEVLADSELYYQFYRYVEDIRFCQYGAPPSLPPELADLPGHLYFDLLCLG